LISAFEAVACGVAANLPEWRKLDPARRTAALRSKVQSMWSDGAFTGRIGIGVPARDRIPHSVGYGRAHFAP
jgi:hypothetical protein